jgi:hypothetical protein
MQIKNTFDKETIEKIKKSALIALSGFLIAVIPLLIPGLQDAFKANPTIAALVAVVGSWLVNTLREYKKGQGK